MFVTAYLKLLFSVLSIAHEYVMVVTNTLVLECYYGSNAFNVFFLSSSSAVPVYFLGDIRQPTEIRLSEVNSHSKCSMF